MLADCLTKRGGKSDGLMRAITSGILTSVSKPDDDEARVHMVEDKDYEEYEEHEEYK